MQEVIETTALVAIHPEIQESIKALRQEGERLQQYAQGLTVSSVADVKRATEDLSMIANLKKALEEKRKEYTQPLNAHLKEINDSFKGMVAPIDSADQTLRGKILAYNREQQRIKEETEKAEALLRQAADIQAKIAQQTGEIYEAPPTIPLQESHPVTKAYTDVGDMSTRTNRKWEVEDFAKVSDEYKMIDGTKVGKVVRAGISAIPGIRIWTEDSLVIKAKKGD